MPPLTLDGTNGVSAVQAGAVESGDLPAGSVIQVVQGSTTIQVSTTSSSFVDTGLTANITPVSASSKVLILIDQSFYNSTASRGEIALQRDSTSIITQGYAPYENSTFLEFFNFNYLDSPSTVSQLTYKTTFRKSGGTGGLDANYDDANGDQASFITLMEIAG
jgi:hypothetical protein